MNGKPDSGSADASDEAGSGGGAGKGGRSSGGGGMDGSMLTDSGPDGEVELLFDAGYRDGNIVDPGAGPPPEDWECLEALWTDGFCDCGCGVRDYDCVQSSCADPGCKEASCNACFAADGTYQSCSPAPSLSDWTCDPGKMSDGLCDCGCGIPDPVCGLAGCTGPGCRAAGCDVRNNCAPGVSTDLSDDCSSGNPSVLNTWTCAFESYGGSDGCDCGCGVLDPDCGCDVTVDADCGCTGARCFHDSCTVCHDEDGRPYACAAAEAGWDEDTTDTSPGSLDVSQCDSLRFDADDGCDCGCGGVDPDCGDDGCADWGCTPDSACKRCTDGFGEVIGCADADDASAWGDNNCDLASYGTDDGCDCGCGAPDPDCDGDGSVNDEYTDTCDVCHDGTLNGFDACPDWDGDCSDTQIGDGQCDCGCELVDPDCRVLERASCTEPGCELTTCQQCNEDGSRMACGGEWTSDLFESACAVSSFDLDGLCDCGCGVADPDCGDDGGCTEKGCSAPKCDVCHDGYLLTQCLRWYCDEDRFGSDDGCDCGCGAPDPDCEDGGGCTQVGCMEDACETCHDPFGRESPCPPGE